MRASKISADQGFGYRVKILVFGMGLLLLLALSKPWFQEQLPSAPSYNPELLMSAIRPTKGKDYPPVLAYWISGTKGDGNRMLRLLKATYHPRNQYLLQLDADTSDYERAELLLSVQSEPVFRAFDNVNVVGKGFATNQMGSSSLAAILHAAAMLLKFSTNWDWFINLSAADYPLVTQDDLLHAMSSLPRDVNFVQYANNTNWKESHNVNQVVVDPSLHLQQRSHLYYTVEQRETPDAFNIFGGSPWLILTRSFMEYCVKGWDNLPRKLLMYFSNTASPLQFYFHTVLCNSPEFQNTTLISNDLRYKVNLLHKTPESEKSEFKKMVDSGAAFARIFKKEEELNQVDKNVLNRMPDGVVPGKWCLGQEWNINGTANWGNINIDDVKPGSYGIKLGILLSKLGNEERILQQPSPCYTKLEFLPSLIF